MRLAICVESRQKVGGESGAGQAASVAQLGAVFRRALFLLRFRRQNLGSEIASCANSYKLVPLSCGRALACGELRKCGEPQTVSTRVSLAQVAGKSGETCGAANWLRPFAQCLGSSADFLPSGSRATVLTALLMVAESCRLARLASLCEESLRRTLNVGVASVGSRAYELASSLSADRSTGSAWQAASRLRRACITNGEVSRALIKDQAEEDEDEEEEQEDQEDDELGDLSSSGETMNEEQDDKRASFHEPPPRTQADEFRALIKLINDETRGRIKCAACGAVCKQGSLSIGACDRCKQQIFTCGASFARVPLASIACVACALGPCARLAVLDDVAWARAMLREAPKKLTHLLDDERDEDLLAGESLREEFESGATFERLKMIRRSRQGNRRRLPSGESSSADSSDSSSSCSDESTGDASPDEHANGRLPVSEAQKSCERQINATLTVIWRNRRRQTAGKARSDHLASESALVTRKLIELGDQVWVPLRAADVLVASQASPSRAASVYLSAERSLSAKPDELLTCEPSAGSCGAFFWRKALSEGLTCCPRCAFPLHPMQHLRATDLVASGNQSFPDF